MKPSRPYHSFTAYHREPGGLRRLDFFVDRLEAWRRERPRASLRVLDIGCGNGNVSLPLAGLGYTVIGVDMDSVSVARARRSAEDVSLSTITFIAGSLEDVSHQTFDAIIASEVLEHQRNPGEFLTQLATLLAPDGILLISVPHGYSVEERVRKFTTHTSVGLALKTWIKRHVTHQDVQSSAAHPHEQFFSSAALTQLCWSFGWRITEMQSAAGAFKGFYYLLGRIAIRRGSALFHALDRMDSWCASYLPFALANGWMLEARRFDPTRSLVMHVLPTLSSGGAEAFVCDLAERLPVRGFDVHVVATLMGGALEERFRRVVPTTILHAHGPMGITAIRSLVRVMRQERPAIVHTHLFGADVCGRIAAKLAGVPIILSTEHNVNADHGWLKRRIKGWLSMITTRFIAVTETVKRVMAEREFIPSRLVTVVPNGIDMSRVAARPSSGFHDIPRMLTVGRLVPQKGYATLFKALALVKAPWVLEIVGDGPLEAELRTLAERLGIAPRIHWLHFRRDVPQRLAETDVFLFPSRWEGFGLALLEALAAGVPCVASDLPVFREFASADDAIFVPVGDVPALAHAIQQLLAHPFPAIERMRTVRARICAEYSIDRATDAYAKIYTDEIHGV